MDPFSAEGELLNLHNAFHQGQYQIAVDFNTSSLSSSNTLPARVLKLRAQIALGHYEDVLADVQSESTPELAAVGALAELRAGNEASAVKTVDSLVDSEGENGTVQILGATVLQAVGRSEEALTLLGQHQGNLEAVALIVQIQLQQNRTDLAVKEVATARKWAQDSLLVNLAESWVGLRVGGEKYQQAFYVFEELAQAVSTSSSQSLVSQAVAEIHLGRLEEAEAALQQALTKDPENAEIIVNSIVLNVIAGKDASEYTRYVFHTDPKAATLGCVTLHGKINLLICNSSLSKIEPDHAFLTDLQEKSDMFDKAATKFSAKVAA
ncbi:coatomer epsilon subunit-domain-containing protein [Calycina marina]|uniref:Coatomer subunit epsilon n=1 Tax=Calycina marina TaxID=1763456 RepID=A0A9P8CFT3_9HELO|nr:coatomer epsilon subunit-domain-containing protein [Calycina marina]